MSRVTRNPDLYRPKPDPREIPKPVPKLAKFHGILFHKRKKFRISLKLKFAADMLSINDINCIRKSFYLNDIFLYLNSMSQIPVVGTLERRISFKFKIRTKYELLYLMIWFVIVFGYSIQIFKKTKKWKSFFYAKVDKFYS